jgi:hypothetical protein
MEGKRSQAEPRIRNREDGFSLSRWLKPLIYDVKEAGFLHGQDSLVTLKGHVLKQQRLIFCPFKKTN